MQIKKLKIKHLRNHIDSEVIPNEKLNIFYGENGSGKTTILEAISIVSFSKSFTNSTDAALIQNGKDYYKVSAETSNNFDFKYKVEVFYQKGQRKKISDSFAENQIPKNIIGNIPLVHLSPDLKEITMGSPENRREFIDKVLSQSSKSYLENLINFKKALKQRNSLLSEFQRTNTFDKNFFESWNNVFIDLATKIIIKRFEFVNEISALFKKIYSEITQNEEIVDLIYEPNSCEEYFQNLLNEDNKNQLVLQVFKVLTEKSAKLLPVELKRGLTLFGPQKDELKILLNNALAREQASQGQHKSMLIALKFAELEFLHSITNEIPVVLLDDLFAELDENRILLVLNKLIQKNAQTFITLTEPKFLYPNTQLNSIAKYFAVRYGQLMDSQL
jgi:DNA replication and repair protein RecF